jgi:hypothetical protein
VRASLQLYWLLLMTSSATSCGISSTITDTTETTDTEDAWPQPPSYDSDDAAAWTTFVVIAARAVHDMWFFDVEDLIDDGDGSRQIDELNMMTISPWYEWSNKVTYKSWPEKQPDDMRGILSTTTTFARYARGELDALNDRENADEKLVKALTAFCDDWEKRIVWMSMCEALDEFICDKGDVLDMLRAIGWSDDDMTD